MERLNLPLPAAAFDALRRMRIPIRSLTHDEIEDMRRSRTAWISLTPARRNNEEEHTAAFYEGLETLARLRLTDFDAWTATVEVLWPVQIKQVCHLLGGNDFRLGVDFATADPALFIKYSGRFLQSGPTVAGGSGSSHQGRRNGTFRLAIPVRLTLLGTEHFIVAQFKELWLEACALLEASRDRVAPVNPITCRAPVSLYHVVDLKIANVSSGRWTSDDVVVFHRVAACGVRVRCPLEPSRSWTMRDNLKGIVQPLQGLLATKAATVSDHQFCATSNIRVSLLSDRRLLDSVFSAVMASRSIREITASDPSVLRRGSRERVWQWLAAVFRHPVEKFTLDCQNLLPEDLEAFRACRTNPNPLGVLFPSFADQPMVATARSFQLVQPAGEGNDEDTIVYDAPLENLPVIGVDEEAEGWVAVLLPGWGRAWVRSADAVRTTASKPLQPTRGPTHISLTNLRSDQAPIVLAFLEQVGESVLKISLSPSKRHETHVNVAAILESVFLACPNLEKLVIANAALPSLDVLAGLYHNTSCHVKHLVLENIYVDEKEDAYFFFDQLKDGNHPMTRRLETFYCTMKDMVMSFPSIQPAVLGMLEHNRRLYDFQIVVGDPLYALHLDDTFRQEMYDGFNGEVIPERLLLPQKLAFLSVVLTDQESTESDPAIPQPRTTIHSLDRDVMTTVLQFAGKAHTRSVRVQFC